MNIFIADHDNRDVVSLAFHYSMLGHRVFLPKPGTRGFGKTPTWPRLVLKSSSNPLMRNLEIHGFEGYDEAKFGEDRFLSQEIEEIMSSLYEKDVTCELIDLDRDRIEIDAWHTTPNAISDINYWVKFCRNEFPNAKWISSCLTHWDHSLKYEPKNIVKFLPANYRDIRPDLNQVGMYRNRIEFEVLNVDYSHDRDRKGWASFNHNFAVRQHVYHKMQEDINAILPEGIRVVNYGGNIRSMGADTKYSGEHGITGNDPTLSPRQAMKKYTEIRGVLHLKQADWAGGVPAMSRFARTPIVVTQQYVNETKSDQVFVDGFNCLIRNSREDIASAVTRINNDDSLFSSLSRGQDEMNNILFSTEYWDGWDRFMRSLR